jgi:hypothetical protein
MRLIFFLLFFLFNSGLEEEVAQTLGLDVDLARPSSVWEVKFEDSRKPAASPDAAESAPATKPPPRNNLMSVNLAAVADPKLSKLATVVQ